MVVNFVDEFLRRDALGWSRDEMCEWLIKHNAQLRHDIHRYKPKKNYIYMITFTRDFKKSPTASQDTVQNYIEKLCKSLGNNVHIVKEHADSNVHWHVSLSRETRLSGTEVQYYRKLYGNVDVSSTKGNSQETAINYMSKESAPKLIS